MEDRLCIANSAVVQKPRVLSATVQPRVQNL